KAPHPGDLIVALGGRTGRDGIHGATFSSTELTSDSEAASGGAVQMGNAITEKMLLDVLLAARDQGLYSAVTDCGAGGFSSAVGEMGERTGAEVWLEKAPLKYEGLTYTEIWISEAQERMVLAVPPAQWEQLQQLCASESVEATVIGRFTEDQQLTLKYNDQMVGQLPMAFLHDGRPPVIRSATYTPPATRPVSIPAPDRQDWTEALGSILSSYNVASKEWVIRQYDHEVQGGSVIKPLVGLHEDGPSDAAVIRPRLDSMQGLAISCGMNPHYGDFDTYAMAGSAIDEAVRNCVAVGADPARISILDNFCWGNTDRPETLGSLVRAALACRDVAVALGTPFISGKDSLNNEFAYQDAEGNSQTIRIPPTLLISAMGQVDDVRRSVTMDLKQAGNHLFIVGTTHDELGGSHLALVEQGHGGEVPRVDAVAARQLFAALHHAIKSGLVRSCHDLSEGGLAVALAEMAFAGGYGARVTLDEMPHDIPSSVTAVPRLLFAESNTRFVCEVEPRHVDAFRATLASVPVGALGAVTEEPNLIIRANSDGAPLVSADIFALKQRWQAPLAW
ncbi:MAG: AIR synthase-related protein, partial [Planctomycetota bacterium]